MKAEIRSLVFTSMAHLVNDGNFLLYPILITFYSLLPNVHLVALGIMAVIYYVLSGALSAPIGVIADKYDKDSFLLSFGIGIQALAMMLFALPFLYPSYIYWLLISAAVLLGVGQAFYHPLGASVIYHTYGSHKAPPAMGINGGFGSVGRAAMPIVIVTLIELIGGFTGLSIIAFYTIISASIIFAGLKFFKRKDYRTSVDEEQDKIVVGKKKGMQIYWGMIVTITIVIFLRSMFNIAIVTFIPTYIDDLVGSSTIMGTVLTLAFIPPIFGQVWFGKLTTKRGGKFTVGVSTALSALVFFILLLFAGDVASTGLVYGITFIGILYGLYAFLTFSGFPILLGYVGQIVPKTLSTTANAMVWGVGQTVGGGVGIAFLSLMLLKVPLTEGMWVMLIFSVISTVLIPFLPSKKNVERKLGQTSAD
ncbi:hypothetical protein IX51_07815 [uncultured archaeon]|nr:hypothetical protein IX51_07815 [uncultured archaeon]HKJ97184.1 MFS transporter [Thermoplasmataceae archaeon]